MRKILKVMMTNLLVLVGINPNHSLRPTRMNRVNLLELILPCCFLRYVTQFAASDVKGVRNSWKKTYHKLKIKSLLNQFLVDIISSSSPVTVCNALNKITGNAVKYFNAFNIDFEGVGVEEVTTSDKHCRNLNM